MLFNFPNCICRRVLKGCGRQMQLRNEIHKSQSFKGGSSKSQKTLLLFTYISTLLSCLGFCCFSVAVVWPDIEFLLIENLVLLRTHLTLCTAFDLNVKMGGNIFLVFFVFVGLVSLRRSIKS